MPVSQVLKDLGPLLLDLGVAEWQEEDGALKLDGLSDLAVGGLRPGPAEDVDGVGVKTPSRKNASHVTRAAKVLSLKVKLNSI